MPSARYWRVVFNGGAAGFAGVNEVEMKATAGGADLATIAQGSSSQSFNANIWPTSRLFDDNDATQFYTNAEPTYAQQDFGVSQEIAEVTLQRPNGGGFEPGAHIIIQSSDDGAAWTDVIEYTGLTWTNLEIKTFATSSGPDHDITITGTGAGVSAGSTSLSQDHGLTIAATAAGISTASATLSMAHGLTITGTSAGTSTDSTPGSLTLPDGFLFNATITGSAAGMQTIIGAPSGIITIGAA